jgi:hypothetical protein
MLHLTVETYVNDCLYVTHFAGNVIQRCQCLASLQDPYDVNFDQLDESIQDAIIRDFEAYE